MNSIRTSMPLMATHEGVWDGSYQYFDADGHKTDEHRSRLICRVLDEPDCAYHQTNQYTWADGRTETRDFRMSWRDGRLWVDNDLISGWVSEVPVDPLHRTLMLYWVRKNEPDTYLYEMIQTSDDGQKRSRVWQWIRDGETRLRTLIDERKVSNVWADATAPCG